MPPIGRSEYLARFEGFELDTRTGELRREGTKTIRLSEQPLRILVTLLERPGELVLREDLRRRLWPNNTVVEFEHSINAAIKRLRQALGDSRESPRFIETLLRRGYRWKTSVEWAGSAPGEAPSAPLDQNLIGKRVSHYRVLEILGGGGMGVVYKAEDIRLGRRVALKFLPEELANDAASMQRFEREARAASALNHPNICTIYEVEEHGGRTFLVMELLVGRTLRDLIAQHVSAYVPGNAKEVLPFHSMVDIALQVCDGLSAAHEKGIIHRDIKPANIFLTSGGRIKLLDFGLAKRWTEEPETARSYPSTEVNQLGAWDLTVTGSTVGTAGYMSPEQIRGEPLDARTDLFSFGLILYELTTGARAFSGNTVTDLRTQVLDHAPEPLLLLNPATPRPLHELIYRAMEKSRDARYSSAAEMRKRLETINAGFRSKTAHRWWMAAAALLIALGLIIWPGWKVHSKAHPVSLWKQRQLTANSNDNPVGGGAISPDGKQLVFTDSHGIELKSMNGGDITRIPDPEIYRNLSPVWEIGYWLPDSTHFFAIAEFPQKPSELWLLSNAGSGRRLRQGANPWGVSPDGTLVALTENDDHEIWLAEPDSGKQTQVVNGGSISRFRAVHWSPDGRHFAYIRNVMVDGRNESHIEIFEQKTGASHEIASGPSIKSLSELEEGFQDMLWLSPERILFVAGELDINGANCNLWELDVDPVSAQRVSGPEQITNWAGFGVTGMTKTADGRHLVLSRFADAIGVYAAEMDPARNSISTPRRITHTDGLSFALGWRNDGESLIILSNRNGKWEIFEQKLDSPTAKLLFTALDRLEDMVLAPDGESILFQKHDPVDPPSTMRLMRAGLNGGGEQQIFQGKAFRAACARSVNGCVLAETGPGNGQLFFSKLDPFKGKGERLGSIQFPHANEMQWVLSPDASRVAIFQHDAPDFDVLSFQEQRLRHVQISGGAALRSLTWSEGAEALFATNMTSEGPDLLTVDLNGKTNKIWHLGGNNAYLRVITSPDGKHLVLSSSSKSSNMWILEDF